ncbi:MAG: TIGR00730 family Rossman fold protein [Bdellovibrionales bacterium]|nr:TIGR00730 family Rossman fold protein [Bdellovibrionales bacterium]
MAKVCVFAGARKGNDPIYMKSARKLGELIASRGDHLYYGGSFVGCMGEIAKSALEAGGTVTGIIPKVFEHLITEEHENLEVIVTEDLFDRKRLMIEESDQFFAFPGGLGTVDEILEVLTLNQIGIIEKPITVLNLNGHFDWLNEKITLFQKQGFMGVDCVKQLKIVNTVSY